VSDASSLASSLKDSLKNRFQKDLFNSKKNANKPTITKRVLDHSVTQVVKHLNTKSENESEN